MSSQYIGPPFLSELHDPCLRRMCPPELLNPQRWGRYPAKTAHLALAKGMLGMHRSSSLSRLLKFHVT